jgi:hypothetical protein
MSLNDIIIAFDLKTVRDAQENLCGIWRRDMDCLSYADFEEMKRILRQMEDYLENKLDIGIGNEVDDGTEHEHRMD